MLSTHKVEVVPVALEPHGNANSLSVVRLFDGGFSVVVRTADWIGKSIGAWIPPDSLVDTERPEFAFLAKPGQEWHRVRAIKLRGVQSFGLLMAAPPGAKLGDDAAAFYGVLHFDPEAVLAGQAAQPRKRGFWRSVRTWYWKFVNLFRGRRQPQLASGGDDDRAPEQLKRVAKYDVDALRRYKYVFQAGEPVMVTEKLDGANGRFCWLDGRLWCGSRNQWKVETEADLWWRVARQYPAIAEFCQAHPGCILYGEVYGQVQSLKYGTKPGEIRFAAFDVLTSDGTFMDARAGRGLCDAFHLPCVPLLSDKDNGSMPFDFDAVCAMAEGPSRIPGANHFREGCVIKPLVERWHQSVGRVCLKVVSAAYLEKAA